MAELALWRDIGGRRPELIRAARAAGHSWEEIIEASGLSRAAVFRLARIDKD